MASQRDPEFPIDVDVDAERPTDETDDEIEVVVDVPSDVDPADYIDQHRAVPLGDDHD